MKDMQMREAVKIVIVTLRLILKCHVIALIHLGIEKREGREN